MTDGKKPQDDDTNAQDSSEDANVKFFDAIRRAMKEETSVEENDAEDLKAPPGPSHPTSFHRPTLY